MAVFEWEEKGYPGGRQEMEMTRSAFYLRNILHNMHKTIYFHVGTGKTGTTFLQYRVFPKMEGIFYIQRTRYQRAARIIQRTHHPKYLVSREFDQQLEAEVTAFAQAFPEARPIIVFRRHDSYIASQYRRFVKNGFTGPFEAFFDLKGDAGYFKKQDLDYNRQIRILEKCFAHPPLVLIYEDLKKDPRAFIDQLARYMQVTIDHDSINFRKKHASYSEKQLKAVRNLGQYIDMRKRRVFRNGVLHFIWRLYLGSIRYGALYLARLLPDRFYAGAPLLPDHRLEEVRRHYEEDWQQCLAYAGRPRKTDETK